MASSPDLVRALTDISRPCFLFGCTPPREGVTEAEARKICAAFSNRSAVLATDGFIIYDLQDESVRTKEARPFPFRKTMDAAKFASFFFTESGKRCVVYKAVQNEETAAGFDDWVTASHATFGHSAFTLVGSPSSTVAAPSGGLTLLGALQSVAARKDGVVSGCVAIAERHTKKGNEHENMMRKGEAGASYFITQGIFDAAATIRLLCEYGELCRAKKTTPKKVVLTFAPVGKRKTLDFIKWLGMSVPEALEARIFAAESPVKESLVALGEVLVAVLQGSAGSGVPLGLNVESVSIVKEEIDAAHTLFQNLQAVMLNTRGSPWAIRWFFTSDALAQAEGEASRALAVVRRDLRDLFEARGKGGEGGVLLSKDTGLILSVSAIAALAFLMGRMSSNIRRV